MLFPEVNCKKTKIQVSLVLYIYILITQNVLYSLYYSMQCFVDVAIKLMFKAFMVA